MTALLTKGYLILVALFSLVLGFYMMFAPDVNSCLLYTSDAADDP